MFLLAIPCEAGEANLSESAVRLIITCSLEMELYSVLRMYRTVPLTFLNYCSVH